MEDRITPIGITNYRSTNIRFGIKDKDRKAHIYTIGKSGTGKSTLLKNMAISDILQGNGLAVIDPHGDAVRSLIRHIPEGRKNELIFFDATNLKQPIAFNPLHGIHPNFHHLVASGLVSTFKKIWAESWGPRMEHILRFSLLTLLCTPGATLLDVQQLLTNKDFRVRALSYVTDASILQFWQDEFDKYSPTLRSEAIAPILNKFGLFQTSLPLRKIVGQKVSSFRMQRVLDDGKILLVNLSKGEIGEDASALLGSMLLTSMQLAALHRASQLESLRTPFYVYVDEMQSFVTRSFADMLSEARKFGLSLFLTHQYLEQLADPVRAAIFGNVGTIISFRIGIDDADVLAREFYPVFEAGDFVSLPRYHMYLRLMIDGTVSEAFSAISLPAL